MRIKRKRKEDRGSSNTISFILIIGFVMTLLISFIDIGIYFNTKNELQTAAENGARNVALYGGTDNKLRGERNAAKSEDIVKESIRTKYDVEVEQGQGNKKVVSINSVKCGPEIANAGDTVECKVKYKYNGIAGKFSLFNIGNKGEQTVIGNAVSEVNTEK